MLKTLTTTRKKALKIDAVILRILYLIKQDKTIEEIRVDLAESTGEEFKSVGSVHRRLVKLQENGLVEAPPRPKMARSRKLTALGEEVLNGFLATTPKAESQPSGDAGGPEGQAPIGRELSAGEPAPASDEKASDSTGSDAAELPKDPA